MIHIKTSDEIELMKTGGKIAADSLIAVCEAAKEGVSTLELDQLAEDLIIKAGGMSSFKTVRGYKYTICTTVNDAVVHGLPSSYRLKKGDICGIDLGVLYKGFHTDVAATITLDVNPEVKRFVDAGKRAVKAGISEARLGNRIGHISRAMQKIIEGEGYSVVRSLTGHGVGRKLHEDPIIPGFLVGPLERTLPLKEGMTLAIEIIYTQGSDEVIFSNSDGWTISTVDGSLGGLCEKSIAITPSGPIVLTEYGWI